MKIVDAVWEKRNLGVSCYEIQMETEDQLQEITDRYEQLQEKQYMVVKIPSSRYDLAYFFQNQGYQFIESVITMTHNLKNISVPKRLQRICDDCSWQVMDEMDLEQLSGEIKNNIFKTDRIYIDPWFSPELAARRYDCWIKDLVQAGSLPYKVLYQGETVGFFHSKITENKVCKGIFNAVYKDYENTGMGYCTTYASMMFAKESGARRLIGCISANNPMILRTDLSLGATIKRLDYVFIKHNEWE